jgi:glycosyltransferase involved in cell wall biosynthesis
MLSPRRVTRAATGVVRAGGVRVRTAGWRPDTRLFVVSDGAGWAIDDEAAYVADVAARAGYVLGPPGWARHARRQAVFHTSHFSALQPQWVGSSHRLGMAYFHGRPGTPGFPEFDLAHERLRACHDRFAAIQVTHGEIEQLVLAAGVPAERVHRIPIGIDLERFPLVEPEGRAASRGELGLPESAFVVGSFQKDGVGWGDGEEPKAIKGPDVLVDALALLAERVDDLVVLLTGPARGFVRQGLTERGVAHVHRLLLSRDALAGAYRALDATVVASRQEGGPKSVLESMATGVPLVSTRAGQATELVVDGVNGLLVDVEDVEGIADALERIRDAPDLVTRLRTGGRATAEENAHATLEPRWEALLADLTGRQERS